MYFSKKAGVQHVDALSEQSTTLSESLGCVGVPTGSLKWSEAEFMGVMAGEE